MRRRGQTHCGAGWISAVIRKLLKRRDPPVALERVVSTANIKTYGRRRRDRCRRLRKYRRKHRGDRVTVVIGSLADLHGGILVGSLFLVQQIELLRIIADNE